MSEIHQRTLVIVKPDGVARGLVGDIVGRFEPKRLSLVGLRLLKVDRNLAQQHYAEHKAKPFFESLVSFITSGPVVVMAWEGNSAIEVVRTMVGPTSGLKAPPGTIRGDLALSMQNNLIHASDSPDSARRELELWFRSDGMVAPGEGSGSADRAWLYSTGDLSK